MSSSFSSDSERKMRRVCPKPGTWDEIYEQLLDYAHSHDCTPPAPPTPLILAGWAYSSDVMRMEVWKETVAWAERNGCPHIVNNIPDQDYYFVEKLSNFTVGPYGGPMYREWDFEEGRVFSSKLIAELLGKLRLHWSKIVGNEMGEVTQPIAFTGRKARRLLVFAEPDAEPPWGGWSYLSDKEEERRTFTKFRAAVNKAIAPHEVDHIDFTTDENAV